MLFRAAILILIFAGTSKADTLPNFQLAGKVVAVEDGDTLTIEAKDRARFRIRLSDIDSPEIRHGDRPGQPFGRAAAASLRSMALGRQAQAACYEIDKFGRAVCHVAVDGIDTSQEQLRRGWAMVIGTSRWVRRPEAARASESEARAERRGIWRDTDPATPASWRQACWQGRICPDAEE